MNINTLLQYNYMENSVEVLLFLEETQNVVVMYNISASIVPQTPLIILSQDLGNITVEITSLTYNIPYSVSINVSVCRNVSGTATIPLLFSKF